MKKAEHEELEQDLLQTIRSAINKLASTDKTIQQVVVTKWQHGKNISYNFNFDQKAIDMDTNTIDGILVTNLFIIKKADLKCTQ